MTTSTNQLAEALREKARTSHDENVSTVLAAVADTVEEIGLTALQGPGWSARRTRSDRSAGSVWSRARLTHHKHDSKFASKGNEMKAWHWGLIIAIVVAYLVGVKYPSIGTTVLGKVGLS